MKCYFCKAILPVCPDCTALAGPSLTKWYCDRECLNKMRAKDNKPPISDNEIRIPFNIPT